MAVSLLVLDTHVVLDILVFQDPAVDVLRDRLRQRQVLWLATPAMRVELVRVLGYPRIAAQVVQRGLVLERLVYAMDQMMTLRPDAAPAPVRCRDPDDQMFIDLALAHGARLLSRDREVLCLAKPLLALGVSVSASFCPADA